MTERVYPRGLAPGQHCPCNGTGVIEHSGGASLEVCEHQVYFTDGPGWGLIDPKCPSCGTSGAFAFDDLWSVESGLTMAQYTCSACRGTQSVPFLPMPATIAAEWDALDVPREGRAAAQT